MKVDDPTLSQKQGILNDSSELQFLNASFSILLRLIELFVL